eukprot:CAMPEP_0170500472 /NCGR_PEP_ID=MMETSP0208-20121228/34961_1 /TAXON_ID=197538 /ORGANISM="Strombidium inclinatum, Strain S3" /LENGTH=74 /DNA_ID=CAMNT_0010778535 /DNA_START=912 /DNA_END=1136 /DNA_ORIENTATION=-
MRLAGLMSLCKTPARWRKARARRKLKMTFLSYSKWSGYSLAWSSMNSLSVIPLTNSITTKVVTRWGRLGDGEEV